MHPFQMYSLVEQRQQALLREAEAMRTVDRLSSIARKKVKRQQLWYQVLSLPLPVYDGQTIALAEAFTYDWLRRRTKSLLLTSIGAAFGLGVLAGGWLDNRMALFPTLLIGAVLLLMGCIPVLLCGLVFLKKRVSLL